MNGDDVARAFFRQHAAEIAEALREQDEMPKKGSMEALIPGLYRSLCFDEPMIESDVGHISTIVSGLNRQLLSPSSPYALSDRLVNGILYLSKRKDSSDKNKTAPTQESIAMTKLAFCVTVQLPLQVCQSFENLSAVKKLLGSYKGILEDDRGSVSKADAKTKNDSTTDDRVDMISDSLNGTALSENKVRSTMPKDGEDDSSLKEVWAAESDPSDYDYGEGGHELPQQSGFEFQEEDWLDPRRLSRPDASLSQDQARLAVGSLLKQANYNVLEPLFSLSNKEVEKYVSELSQLILILLQPNSPLGNGDTDMALTLQTAILSPLWILRDAAIHEYSGTQRRPRLSSSYLDVLQTLLAMDQAHVRDLGGSKDVELCTASIVGLSALSSWCGMPEISIHFTTTCVLDAMNDVSYVVERATEKYQANLLHSLIPIMELLSGITYQQSQTGRIGKSTSIAQTVMSSGFLRQLLALGLEEKIETARHFHHALWGLAVSHPTIVGKYVARYPGIEQLVRNHSITPESSTQDCVSSILWNCFGYTHAEVAGQSQAPRVVWKTSSAKHAPSTTPLSRDECSEVCQKSWARLCQIVSNSILESSKEPEKALSALDDWERLLSFVAVPSMVSTFVELLDSLNLEQVAKALHTSQQHLSADEVDTETATADARLDDKMDDPDDKPKSSKSNHQIILSNTRKLIKQYTLFFQGNVGGSSKTD
eukprot:scaffold1525_cov142-Cylindrotheca_fusiformis.AAC.148